MNNATYFTATAGQTCSTNDGRTCKIKVGDKVRTYPNGYTPVVVEVLAVRYSHSDRAFQISVDKGACDYIWQNAGGVETVEQWEANRYSGYDYPKN